MGYKILVVKDSTSEDDLRRAPVGSVKHNIYKKLVEGMSKLNQWGEWQLDMTRWIPAWDPSPNRVEP